MALPILDGNQTAATLSTIITGGAHIPAHTVVSLGSQAISDITSGVSGSVVSISNFPPTQTIAGTVTANARSDIYDGSNDVYWNKSVVAWGNPFLGEPTLVEQSTPLPVSGTVTANVLFSADVGESMPPQAVALGFYSGDDGGIAAVNDSNRKLPISGTVTIGALPSGSLTTRFGSVVTANESFITSAVTNTSRKYLLAQNISAGTATIGIGFSPTTTQGIQLTAGGGLTFDAFCPTGAVYWLGAVTGAAFTILEG